LRYVPIAGLARSPTRFSIVVMLGCAILFALALEWIGRRYPKRRWSVLVLGACLTIAELLPLPVSLHSAAVPGFYQRVAAAPAEARVLALPFGVRDGTRSAGDFSARTLFHQTAHGKAIVGGYLSRLAWRRLPELQNDPVLYPLIILSERKPLPADAMVRALDASPAFIADERIGFVVIDRARASDALRSFAVRAFRLEHLVSEGELELFRPADGRPSEQRAPAAAAP
jgi:hypothetical protein